MLNVKNVNVDNALRGARNPYISWNNSDSYYDSKGLFIIGKNDLCLAKKLCKAGTDHRKLMRQYVISRLKLRSSFIT